MRIIAWIGLISMILTVLVQLKDTFTDKEVSGRVAHFIGILLHSCLTYFFIMYLFK